MNRWYVKGVLCSAAALLLLSAGAVCAGEAAKKPAQPAAVQSSLELIPEDAAFYCAMLRNREQIEIIGRSKGWKALMDMPAVQEGLKRLDEMTEDSGSPGGKAKAVLESPQIKDVLDLLADMFSEDVFLYGDPTATDTLELLQQVNFAVNYGPILLKATGEAEQYNEAELRGAVLLETLAAHIEKIKAPGVIVGFKVQDTERAKRQLEGLAGLLTGILLVKPEWSGMLDRVKVDGCEYVTLAVDGKMIPWNQLPLEKLKEIEREEGDADKVIAKLKGLKLVLALGVRSDYLLVSVGESTKGLARLAKGTTLASRPEMKPLAKFADRRLTWIGYASQEMLSRVAVSGEDVDSLVKVLDDVLDEVDLSEEQEARIRKDASALAADLKGMIPRPGARMSFSFFTDQGQESYGYSWADAYGVNAAKPLGLLEHVGGSPLLAFVCRFRTSPGDYDTLARWVQTGFRYFEEFAVPKMRSQDRQQYDKVKEELRSLAKRADAVNRDLIVPALADGQCGIVLDASGQTSQWPKEIPAEGKPLPVAEPALVIGVSDADKIRQAYTAYQEIFNDLVEAVRAVDPDAVPADYRIPWPDSSEIAGGTMISYQLPRKWRLDERIRPNAAISDGVLVVSTSQAHSERLLKATPLEPVGVLADTKKPLAAACVLDWAGLVDAAAPWVEMAARKTAEHQLRRLDEEDRKVEVDKILDQVRTVLKVLKTIRHATAEVYLEQGATVQHSRTEIRDIE